MTNTTGHRLVGLRAHSAGCSCGAMYVGDGSADLRAQHRAHKANPAPKRTTRKATGKANATAGKPSARKSAK